MASHGPLNIARRFVLLSTPPLLALAGVHFYNKHDNRDLNATEILNAQSFLENLDGHKRWTTTTTRASIDSTSTSTSAIQLPVELQQHMLNLKSVGVTLIKSVLSPKEAVQWDGIVSQQLITDGACIVPSGGAIGRTHCRLIKRNRQGKGDGIYEALAEVPIHNPHSCSYTLNDIAREYFASHGIQEGQYKMAQLQLLDAAPGSSNQDWHRDNVKPGLTALIALRDVEANGPTELLLRSHCGSMGRTRSILKEYSLHNHDRGDGDDDDNDDAPSLPRILLAAINSGDAIIYDAR